MPKQIAPITKNNGPGSIGTNIPIKPKMKKIIPRNIQNICVNLNFILITE